MLKNYDKNDSSVSSAVMNHGRREFALIIKLQKERCKRLNESDVSIKNIHCVVIVHSYKALRDVQLIGSLDWLNIAKI